MLHIARCYLGISGRIYAVTVSTAKSLMKHSVVYRARTTTIQDVMSGTMALVVLDSNLGGKQTRNPERSQQLSGLIIFDAIIWKAQNSHLFISKIKNELVTYR